MFDAFRKTAVLTAVFAAALLCSCIKSDGSTHVECPSAAAPAPNETPRGISSVDGVWLMLDKDADNEPESVIVVYERGGLRFAKMVAIYHNGKIDDTIEKPLERAKGLAGNPPLCGLDFVWNLKPSDGGKYVGKIDRVKNERSLPLPATKKGDVLTLHALLSDRSPEWAAGCFAGVRVLRLGYTPADAAGFACEAYQEEDTTLFYRGHTVEELLSRGAMFPTLSHA